MALRAVFLDVGDTLLREPVTRFAIYARTARRLGADVDEAGMRELMLRVHHALPLEIEGGYRYSDPWFRRFIRGIFVDELGLVDAPLEEVTDELFERFESAATFELFPGALDLFDALAREGLRLGIISNWSARLPRLLEALGISDRFDPLLSSAIEGVEKPDHAIFLRALERAGVSPAEALHAGDHPEKDVAPARALGMAGVLVDHFGRFPEDTPQRVGSLNELRDCILGRCR